MTSCARCGLPTESRTGPSPAIIAKPYTLKDARDRLADVSGDREFADDFFDQYIEGRELPDYATLFARVGLVLRRRNPQALRGPVFWTRTCRSCPAWTPRRCRPLRTESPTGGGVGSPASCNWGTPAFNAGLEEGDVITAVDGRADRERSNDGGSDWRAQARRPDGGRTSPAMARRKRPRSYAWRGSDDGGRRLESTGAP